jgi:hypothetical protein
VKKTVRHRPKAWDLIVLIPGGIFGVLFIGFFLLMSVFITWELIAWSVQAMPRLRQKDVVVVAILLIICFGFVSFCGWWLFRVVTRTLQSSGVLVSEIDLPSRGDVANTFERFVADPDPFSSEIEVIFDHDFDDDQLLRMAQSELEEILNRYEEYGGNGEGLRAADAERLTELSRKLREDPV